MFEEILLSRFLKGLISILVFNKVGKEYMTKTYHRVIFLSIIIKIFEKLVNIRLIGQLESFSSFSFPL